MVETKKRPRVFITTSQDKSLIFNIIKSVFANNHIDAEFADEMLVGESIRQNVQNRIQSSDLIIADVTDASSNVIYEIGAAQAINKPIVFLAQTSRSIPSDLASFPVIIYGNDKYDELLSKLSRSISSALIEPSEFLTSRAEEEKSKRKHVFISYSHIDIFYMERLMVHLKPLEKQGLIDPWVDTRLKAGDKWKNEIAKALNRATVAILLVSADFLASDFIINDELPPILRKAEEDGTRIIPLIVKPCRFARDKILRHFQAINNPNDALIRLTEAEQESYYDSVAAEVESILGI